MRTATCNRKTAETDITLTLDLDGTGKSEIDSGVGFLNHMLTLLTRHARMDMILRCAGDTQVDDHHSVEDIAIALGEALKAALGEKRGIKRYGSMLLPMDEALVMVALDLSGRGCLRYKASIPTQKIGSFDTELVQEFFLALTRTAGMTLHIQQLDGENSHHIVEAMFKGVARALKDAVAIDPTYADEIPSTKGVL